MHINNITESTVEQATLDWFNELGYSILYGPDMVWAVHELPIHSYERASYSDVILESRILPALTAISSFVPKSPFTKGGFGGLLRY